MAWSFWLNYFLALVVVGLMLTGLFIVTRSMARNRVLSTGNRRLVNVLESTMLSQHVAVHVVKVGQRYLLIGGSNNGAPSTLAEIPADEAEAWLAQQRETAGAIGWKSVLESLRGRT